MNDQFQLSKNIIRIYQEHGEAWIQLRGSILYEKAWLDHFLSLLPNQATILDLGCGSGKTIAAYFIQQGHRIIGIDSSITMIKMAQHHFPEQVWYVSDMRTIDLKQKFQGILAWDSFFHLTQHDQREMFKQFSLYAESGTALMFTSGPSHGEAIGDLFGEALYHASLSQQEYRSLLKLYGFNVIKMVVEDETCTGHTVWLAQKE